MAVMELRHLRYFVMVAEESNISRAAARLNISQPAVSRQIRDLEQELGAELFQRDRSGLRLTAAGTTALAHARELLRQANTLQEAVRLQSGKVKTVSLRIGYIPTALSGFLSTALRRFNEQHPHVCVQIEEMTPARQARALQQGDIDIGLLGTPDAALRRQYRTESIREVQVAVALPDDHPLADRTSLKLAELDGAHWLTLTGKQFPGRPEMMRTMFEQAGISLPDAHEVQGLSEILGQVGSGGGVALVPADIALMPHPGVTFVALSHPTWTLNSSAAWRADRETEELRALVALLKQV